MAKKSKQAPTFEGLGRDGAPHLWNPPQPVEGARHGCRKYRVTRYRDRNLSFSIISSRATEWWDKPRLVADHVPDGPPKVKARPGPKPLFGRTMTGRERKARWRAKKQMTQEQAAPRTVEDQRMFYKCELCTMYHRVGFEPGLDVRWEERASGKPPTWVEPRERWVWGSIDKLPTGAVLVDAPDTMEETR